MESNSFFFTGFYLSTIPTIHNCRDTRLYPWANWENGGFFQDGCLFLGFSWKHRKNGHRSLKFGKYVAMYELLQEKMPSITKIQNGGFFPRWPPDGARFLDFLESTVKLVIEACNLADIFLWGCFFRKKCWSWQMFKMADFFQDGCQLVPDF